jgi:EmrB/QacA subfamily drug resistance transporter
MAENAGAGRKITLLITALSVFVSPFMVAAVNIALPTIADEFAMGALPLSWVATGFLLASAAFLVPFGRLADIIGRKKIFLVGMVLFTASSFLCAVSSSTAWLIISRVLQGFSGAMTMGVAVAILTSVFPAPERGKAIGTNMAATYLGLSLGPFLGGVLTEHLGWRSIFYVSAVLGLVVVVLVLWRLKGEWAEARGEKYDFVGSAAFSVSIVLVMYGFTVLLDSSVFTLAIGSITVGIPGYAFFVVGLAGLVFFVLWEAGVESPVFNVKLFKGNAPFVFSNMATLINYSSAFAMSFLLSLYLQYTRGYTPQTAGLITVVSPVFMTVFSPLAGRISDRIEPRLVASFGLIFTCVALLIFVFLGNDTALWMVIVGLAVYGIGTGLFSSPNTNAVMSSVNRSLFGVASGSVATMRSIGMMLSMGIVMILFSLYMGNIQISSDLPAFLESVQMGFIIFAALSFISIFIQFSARHGKSQAASG